MTVARLDRIPFTPPPMWTGDPESWATALNKYLAEQFELIQSLTGGSLRWRNLRSDLILNYSLAGGVNVPPHVYTINHGLNTIPAAYLVMPITPMIAAANQWELYATTTNRSNWTDTTIDLTLDDTTSSPGNHPQIDFDLWLLA